jgi:hypothetical protein
MNAHVPELMLVEARRKAIAYPLDGQTPPSHALFIELPMERAALVILSTERSIDGAAYWVVSGSVRGSADLTLPLDHEAACKVACERAVDGVGMPMASWTWDPETLTGMLRCRCTAQEEHMMPPSPPLPNTLGIESLYLRPLAAGR